jgi:hypothetical protein
VWLVSALHSILTNVRYLGRVVWNRSEWVKDLDSGKRQRCERQESERIVRAGPALVSEETWSRIRARMSERQRVYGVARGARPKYLLSGLLYCEDCSAKLVATGSGGSHYYCSTQRGQHNTLVIQLTRFVRRAAAARSNPVANSTKLPGSGTFTPRMTCVRAVVSV